MEQSVVQSPLFRNYPYPLGLTVFLSQVALGVVLFAVFQEYVPAGLGAGDGWGGFLLAAYGGARFLCETPTGMVSDRIERKQTLLLGLVLLLPAVAVMSRLQAPGLFLVCAALLGAATAFIWPATYAMSADLYPPARRGKVVGFLNVFQLIGFGAGALIGAILVESHSSSMFAIALAAVALAAIATVVALPSYRDRSVPEIESERLGSVWSARLGNLSVLVLVSTTGVSMIVPAIRPFGEDQLRISFAHLTFALIPALLIGAALYVPAGHLADRAGRMVPFLLGELLLVGGCIVISLTTSLPVAIIAAVFIFGGNVTIVPAFNAAVMDLAPEDYRGTLIGLMVAISGLGLALGPLIGGFVLQHGSAPDLFRIAGLAGIASAIGVVLYSRRYGGLPRHAVFVQRPD
ncbi:MAG: MFS transporter [Dehalococcoidia bacterium]|nr:MFS transporter [Dehalococcoidia bacterium]MCB9484808.1 MFS transporter [Thermoflexaceae bacterium]